MRRERGSISAVVVCLTLSAIALSGLVFDGGNMVKVYSQLSDIAENTGRVGAQHISGIRSGNPYINYREALAVMKNFSSTCHCHTSFDIQKKSITVTMARDVRIHLLGLVGVSQRGVQVVRTVEIVDG